MTNLERLGQTVSDLYTRAGFGRVLKSELDLAFFGYFLREKVDPRFRAGDKIKYLHIDKAEIYRLSLSAGMPEARFKRLLEESFLLTREPPAAADFLLDLINQLRVHKSVLVAGRVRLLVPNPIARKYLEDRAYRCGATVDYETNQEVVSLTVEAFLKIVEVSEDPQGAAKIRSNLLAKAALVDDNPELKAFVDELTAVPLEERAARIGRALVEKFTGKVGEEILDSILTAAKGLGRQE